MRAALRRKRTVAMDRAGCHAGRQDGSSVGRKNGWVSRRAILLIEMQAPGKIQ